jgi:hypothetical protein
MAGVEEILHYLCERVRSLEANPEMRKGILVNAVIGDETVDWDALFTELQLRGRHRRRKRWRRVVLENTIQRRFVRGGRRPRPRTPPVGLPPISAADQDARAFAGFSPASVWDHFCVVYPVLALYRRGWAADRAAERNRAVALRPHPETAAPIDPPPDSWAGLWLGQPSVCDIGSVLRWPQDVMGHDALPLVLPVARRLWPQEPWDRWVGAGGTAVQTRAAVPYLRRAACLLHGRGATRVGGSPRWASTPAAGPPPVGCGRRSACRSGRKKN